jgi:hypothetical protein
MLGIYTHSEESCERNRHMVGQYNPASVAEAQEQLPASVLRSPTV